jgi:hypothetical protein
MGFFRGRLSTLNDPPSAIPQTCLCKNHSDKKLSLVLEERAHSRPACQGFDSLFSRCT